MNIFQSRWRTDPSASEFVRPLAHHTAQPTAYPTASSRADLAAMAQRQRAPGFGVLPTSLLYVEVGP
jgi:hypothetical protein